MATIVLVVSKSHGLAALQSVIASAAGRLEVVTTDDRGSAQHTAYEQIVQVCAQERIPLHVLSGKDLNPFLIAKAPDLCLVVGWYWMIDSEARHSCRLGAIGIHHSLLPQFRGGAPLVWSLIAGSREVGSSLFILGDGLDDGDLLWQWRLPVDSESTPQNLLQELEFAIQTDLGGLVGRYLVGDLSPAPQSDEGLSYGALRSREDSRLDWSLEPSTLEAHSKALQSPYPRLFFEHSTVTYEVLSLIPAGHDCFGGCGVVLNQSAEGILVKCGSSFGGVILRHILRDGLPVNLEIERPFRLGAKLS